MRLEPARRSLARAAATGAAVVICIAAGVLVADYVKAVREEPPAAASIAELQVKAQTDRSVAPLLAREQDRITRSRERRKARKDALSVLLIVAGVTFVAAAKSLAAADVPRSGVLPARAIPLRPVPPTTGTAPPAPAPASAPAVLDLSFVDHLIEQVGRSKESAIPILQAIQAHYRYLPDEALRRVVELTDITPAQVAGTSTFYARFRRSPVGEHIVRVCHGTACHVSGARPITDELRRHLQIAEGADTDPNGTFTIDEVACLGCCSLAPVLMIDHHTAGRLTPSSACAALDIVRPLEST